MKRLKLIILLTPFVFVACTNNSSDTSKFFRIPWPDANHQYALQDVEIQSFSEPQYLRGEFAEFYVEPSLQFELHRLEQPGTPSGRFISTPTGSRLPVDTASFIAVTIYAHLERLHILDVATGAAKFLVPRPLVGNAGNHQQCAI